MRNSKLPLMIITHKSSDNAATAMLLAWSYEMSTVPVVNDGGLNGNIESKVGHFPPGKWLHLWLRTGTSIPAMIMSLVAMENQLLVQYHCWWAGWDENGGVSCWKYITVSYCFANTSQIQQWSRSKDRLVIQHKHSKSSMKLLRFFWMRKVELLGYLKVMCK